MIHSRRTIQKCLDELRAEIDETARTSLIQKLNLNNTESLATEWEIAILWALSKLGHIKYEPNTGGPNRFDVLFKLPEKDFDLLADITTLSDDSLKRANPADYFIAEVQRFLRKGDQATGNLTINIEAPRGRSKKEKVIDLKLPEKGNIPTWVKSNLSIFRSKIRSSPLHPHCFSSQDLGGRITITFNPSNKNTCSAQYISNTVIYNNSHNPISERLKKKSKQYRGTGHNGLNGIFLCDGGCSTLSKNNPGGPASSIQDIVNAFFCRSKQFDFVYVLFPTRNFSSILKTRKGLHTNVKLFFRDKLDTRVSKQLGQIREHLVLSLPEPENEGYQARQALSTNWEWSGSFIGGFAMEKNLVKVPSRLFASLLSGNLTHDEYSLFYNGSNLPSLPDIVQTFINEGRMIVSTRVELCPEKDDDWIVVEFGNPDAAISDFK